MFLHEGDASECGEQFGVELVRRQITLYAHAFVAISVEDDNPWGPESAEAVKDGALLADISGEGDEIAVDRFGDLRVGVGFGFQPNASASSGRSGEVEQHGLVRLLGFGKGSFEIASPLDEHRASLC